MAADTAGNDLTAVAVPKGGLVAFAPYDPANVIADSAIGVTPLELPTAYKTLGLIKEDGAPQHGWDTDDAIELWQKGYSISGDGTRTLQVAPAENNDAVDELVEGKVPDENGVIYVDSSLPEARVILFAATAFKNGEEARYNGVAQVTAVEFDQDTRGEINAKTVTLTWKEDDLFNGAPFKRWRGTPVAATTGTGA